LSLSNNEVFLLLICLLVIVFGVFLTGSFDSYSYDICLHFISSSTILLISKWHWMRRALSYLVSPFTSDSISNLLIIFLFIVLQFFNSIPSDFPLNIFICFSKYLQLLLRNSCAKLVEWFPSNPSLGTSNFQFENNWIWDNMGCMVSKIYR
jgi:hypothetical protein